ncbi:hypothetical protein BJX61DRAFT_534005 [Aspergillus egyptiacus]|nr:hypothetical protein BJX61DRAFT_534005 [Aspergillus egyptiacus]
MYQIEPRPSTKVLGGRPQSSEMLSRNYRSIVPQIELFEQLRVYPFISDPEFAQGLAIILGHPDIPASEKEIGRNDALVLQAKCYYFTRKKKLVSPVNVEAYRAWLEARPLADNLTAQVTVAAQRGAGSSATPLPPKSEKTEERSNPASLEPAYPTSFAHIVELITTGQPIPGIQQIPDTLLTGQGAPSARQKRRKPWEKEEITPSSINPGPRTVKARVH